MELEPGKTQAVVKLPLPSNVKENAPVYWYSKPVGKAHTQLVLITYIH